MSGAAITFEDVKRALDDRSPEAADLIVRYLEQNDPREDRAEGAEEADPAAADAFTTSRLRGALHPNTLDDKTEDEKKAIRADAWKQLMAAPHHPPRLDLGPMFIAFYEGGDPWHQQLLIDVFSRGRLGWGTWKAFKTIYKQAETAHDVQMLGVVLWRLDALPQTPYRTDEILPGTVLYMRRRAWRYLRELGSALPDLYPPLAAQVLSQTIAVARSLDSANLKRATQLVDDERAQRLARDVFCDDQQRLLGLHDLLEQWHELGQVVDLVLVDEDERLVELDLHVLGVGDEVGREEPAIELHALDHR